MMNTMSNNKLNIDELEMVNGGGFWDALVETVSSVLDTVKDEFKCKQYERWRKLI